MAFVRQRVPQEQLRERTTELLAGPAYEQALTDSKIVPFTRPRMELVKLETSAPDYVFEFKAIVPLPPTLSLGKYIGLEVDRERIEVTDDDIERRVESLRERSTDYPVVEDRPAQTGDVVEAELSVTFEDMETDGAFQPTAITIGDPGNVPGVDEALVGVSKGDEKSFELVYPADYPNAGIGNRFTQRSFMLMALNSLRNGASCRVMRPSCAAIAASVAYTRRPCSAARRRATVDLQGTAPAAKPVHVPEPGHAAQLPDPAVIPS